MKIDSLADDILPPELLPIIKAYIEGRVKQALFIVELENGNIMDGVVVHTDDFEHFKMVGAIESIKRDYMRMYMDSRVNYEGRQDD